MIVFPFPVLGLFSHIFPLNLKVRFLKREIGEEKALAATAYMKNCQVVAMDETLALAAADTSLRESLAMADAIILATAHYHDCQVVTSDADLKGKPGVQFIPKK